MMDKEIKLCFLTKEDLTLALWRDKKIVSMIQIIMALILPKETDERLA